MRYDHTSRRVLTTSANVIPFQYETGITHWGFREGGPAGIIAMIAEAISVREGELGVKAETTAATPARAIGKGALVGWTSQDRGKAGSRPSGLMAGTGSA